MLEVLGIATRGCRAVVGLMSMGCITHYTQGMDFGVCPSFADSGMLSDLEKPYWSGKAVANREPYGTPKKPGTGRDGNKDS